MCVHGLLLINFSVYFFLEIRLSYIQVNLKVICISNLFLCVLVLLVDPWYPSEDIQILVLELDLTFAVSWTCWMGALQGAVLWWLQGSGNHSGLADY